ncbi:MAG: hypothetical protein U0169_07955 [Polyangiaceae bacterium]
MTVRTSVGTRLLAAVVTCFTMTATVSASAQQGGGQRAPTQSSPTRNVTPGPRPGSDDDEPRGPSRSEPVVQAPADPLAVPEEIASTIGSDVDRTPEGDPRYRLLPPFYLSQTRTWQKDGLQLRDHQSLTSLLYYHRRSPTKDANVLFPLAWYLRNEDSRLWVFGPVAHRESTHDHDNWLAPLFFEGKRKEGGYFHSLPLLTTTSHDEKSAFTIVGPYFRTRKDSDVDFGVVPFFAHGDNGNTDGAHKSYTFVPLLLTYHREREIDTSSLTVVGPVIAESNAKRDIFDVAPLLFTIRGKPQTGGVRESHTTLFPLFHYGTTEDKSLFVLPGYFRRTTRTADTLLTPLYSHASTRNGSTSLTAVGPVAPLFWHYRDKDTDASALALAPLFYTGSSPAGRGFLTPLFGRFESYGVSRSWWFAPTLTVSAGIHGWETDLHPLVYLGRNGTSKHAVVAPLYWDFANPEGRTTIGFPFLWRFADTSNDSVTQVAANTVYLQKRVSGGRDWQFHVLPVFSYGENPRGYFWNLLFGLAGYERSAEVATVKALWLPIQVAGPKAADGTKASARR